MLAFSVVAALKSHATGDSFQFHSLPQKCCGVQGSVSRHSVAQALIVLVGRRRSWFLGSCFHWLLSTNTHTTYRAMSDCWDLIAAAVGICVSVRSSACFWPVLKRQRSRSPGRCIFWQSTRKCTLGAVRRPFEWRRSGEEMVVTLSRVFAASRTYAPWHKREKRKKNRKQHIVHRRQERPHHADRTTSRPLCEVNRRRARLVLRWGTTCEALMLFLFAPFFFAFFFRVISVLAYVLSRQTLCVCPLALLVSLVASFSFCRPMRTQATVEDRGQCRGSIDPLRRVAGVEKCSKEREIEEE